MKTFLSNPWFSFKTFLDTNLGSSGGIVVSLTCTYGGDAAGIVMLVPFTFGSFLISRTVTLTCKEPHRGHAAHECDATKASKRNAAGDKTIAT
jgi:hypothetical protein